ncbi:hypothetical protein L3i22_065660 [Actinoplanes sp. L3-i22]|nr:hypothetical protein L3i22_065660 [Actinoplanes sp. L3-i22]
MRAWVHGWAISRGVPAPAEVEGGWLIEVGLPWHRRRYVLDEPGPDLLARLGREQATPGTWIKAVGDADRLHAALPAGWKPAETLHVMTTTLRPAPEVTPPAPYTARLDGSGERVTAVVLDDGGQVAASATLALAGGFGIVDRVETVAGHRRRGLGSVVMRTLANHALASGVAAGVLVATDDGRALYQRLGWTVRVPLAAAYLPP